MSNYTSNLTDSQWQRIEKYLNTERKRQYDLRKVWDAISYLVKSGCQWRMLPEEFGQWTAIYYYFREWKRNGLIELIHNDLVCACRKKVNKNDRPSVGIIDSQSAKTTMVAGEDRGFDAGKKVKGRKRHVLVDTLGLLIAVVVHSAAVQDRDGAKTLLVVAKQNGAKLVKIFADGGYAGELVNWVKQQLFTALEIVKRSTEHFQVLPKRWIVERTFAWINIDRRHAKDYERLCESSVALIQLSMIKVMLKKF